MPVQWYIRLFYVDWDPGSQEACQALAEALDPQITETELVNAARHPSVWRETGLRTAPAAQVFHASELVFQLDGTLDVGAIKDALSRQQMPPDEPQRIDGLEVVASSGSYRYGQWAEPFVVDPGAPGMGWSSASLGEPHEPFLVIDARRTYRLTRAGLWPRDWRGDPDLVHCFPRGFALDVSIDMKHWREVLSVQDATPVTPLPRYWDLKATGRYVRLRVTDLRRRRNGRYVCQILGFELWGLPLDLALRPGLAIGSWVPPVNLPEGRLSPLKRGVFYNRADGTVLAAWRLAPGRKLGPRGLTAGVAKLLVIEGSVIVGTADAALSGTEQTMVTAGDYILQPAGIPVTIANPSQMDAALLLEVRSQAGAPEVWGRVTGGHSA